MEIKQALVKKAGELGFNFVGVVAAQPSPHLAAYLAWIGAQMHGEMGYLARPDRQIRREDLRVILPNVQTLICVGLDYHTQQVPAALAADPARGRISNYAWQVDYHAVMTPKLKELGQWLKGVTAQEVSNRVYVDTGAILEKSHASEAGLGFVGKNTLLIRPKSGSYFFLGELLTTLRLEPDIPQPMPNCGHCTRCLTACPTAAFPQPFVLDARKCISYLTIELKGAIPREFRRKLGNWIYGCDICQEVCPWNRFAKPTNAGWFGADSAEKIAPKLLDLLALDEAAFNTRFAHSPIKRIKRRRLLRNVCYAAGNWGHISAEQPLIRLLNDSEPLIRGAAAWALGQLATQDALGALTIRLPHEEDEAVCEEIAAVLGQRNLVP